MTKSLFALTFAMVLTLALPAAAEQASPVLTPARFEHYAADFARQDRETVKTFIPNAAAGAWMAANVPLFECPDPDLEEIYYFRWWTYRKHIRSTPDGLIVDEFLPAVPWAGKHNSISCAAGHHIYEGRWLRDQKVLDDYSVFWFRKGGDPRHYSFWAADALVARSRVLGDFGLARELLPDLIANWEAWEKTHRDPSGLYWQDDGADGMEVSVGGTGCRVTINSYQYGDAMAIARIAEVDGKPAMAGVWREKAAAIRRLVEEKLWDPAAGFYKVLPRGQTNLAVVRELHGYTPWYFDLPGPEKAGAWRELLDPRGFFAPFGPTTTEQRHPGFAVAYRGHECQWNGPSWPYSTSLTLTALANHLDRDPAAVLDAAAWWKVFQCYVRSHRFRQLPPEPGGGDGSLPRVETRQPWIDENLNPFTGDWIARTLLRQRHQAPEERGKDYNHSTFCDLVITGVAGLRPRDDDTLEVNPLAPARDWDYFCLEGVPYHGRSVTVLYDRTGARYGQGTGLHLMVNGRVIARRDNLGKLAGKLP